MGVFCRFDIVVAIVPTTRVWALHRIRREAAIGHQDRWRIEERRAGWNVVPAGSRAPDTKAAHRKAIVRVDWSSAKPREK